jgi:hypothetical protein
MWESWESTRGEVSAASSWRTLSHCVCVVCREEESAMRRDGDSEVGEGG